MNSSLGSLVISTKFKCFEQWVFFIHWVFQAMLKFDWLMWEVMASSVKPDTRHPKPERKGKASSSLSFKTLGFLLKSTTYLSRTPPPSSLFRSKAITLSSSVVVVRWVLVAFFTRKAHYMSGR
ncbi:hypothetical protein HanPI659440_Chr15g0589201 [Helianthus annuus]|nr:hypothetical protein HanPI659440_Chr15g0589201 [Helianthus annuus]